MTTGVRRGPKLKPNRKVPYGTKLRPDQIEWLRRQGPRAAAREIERAIDMRIHYLLRPVNLRWSADTAQANRQARRKPTSGRYQSGGKI